MTISELIQAYEAKLKVLDTNEESNLTFQRIAKACSKEDLRLVLSDLKKLPAAHPECQEAFKHMVQLRLPIIMNTLISPFSDPDSLGNKLISDVFDVLYPNATPIDRAQVLYGVSFFHEFTLKRSQRYSFEYSCTQVSSEDIVNASKAGDTNRYAVATDSMIVIGSSAYFLPSEENISTAPEVLKKAYLYFSTNYPEFFEQYQKAVPEAGVAFSNISFRDLTLGDALYALKIGLQKNGESLNQDASEDKAAERVYESVVAPFKLFCDLFSQEQKAATVLQNDPRVSLENILERLSKGNCVEVLADEIGKILHNANNKEYLACKPPNSVEPIKTTRTKNYDSLPNRTCKRYETRLPAELLKPIAGKIKFSSINDLGIFLNGINPELYSSFSELINTSIKALGESNDDNDDDESTSSELYARLLSYINFSQTEAFLKIVDQTLFMRQDSIKEIFKSARPEQSHLIYTCFKSKLIGLLFSNIQNFEDFINNFFDLVSTLLPDDQEDFFNCLGGYPRSLNRKTFELTMLKMPSGWPIILPANYSAALYFSRILSVLPLARAMELLEAVDLATAIKTNYDCLMLLSSSKDEVNRIIYNRVNRLVLRLPIDDYTADILELLAATGPDSFLEFYYTKVKPNFTQIIHRQPHIFQKIMYSFYKAKIEHSIIQDIIKGIISEYPEWIFSNIDLAYCLRYDDMPLLIKPFIASVHSKKTSISLSRLSELTKILNPEEIQDIFEYAKCTRILPDAKFNDFLGLFSTNSLKPEQRAYTLSQIRQALPVLSNYRDFIRALKILTPEELSGFKMLEHIKKTTDLENLLKDWNQSEVINLNLLVYMNCLDPGARVRLLFIMSAGVEEFGERVQTMYPLMCVYTKAALNTLRTPAELVSFFQNVPVGLSAFRINCLFKNMDSSFYDHFDLEQKVDFIGTLSALNDGLSNQSCAEEQKKEAEFYIKKTMVNMICSLNNQREAPDLVHFYSVKALVSILLCLITLDSRYDKEVNLDSLCTQLSQLMPDSDHGTRTSIFSALCAKKRLPPLEVHTARVAKLSGVFSTEQKQEFAEYLKEHVHFDCDLFLLIHPMLSEDEKHGILNNACTRPGNDFFNQLLLVLTLRVEEKTFIFNTFKKYMPILVANNPDRKRQLSAVLDQKQLEGIHSIPDKKRRFDQVDPVSDNSDDKEKAHNSKRRCLYTIFQPGPEDEGSPQQDNYLDVDREFNDDDVDMTL